MRVRFLDVVAADCWLSRRSRPTAPSAEALASRTRALVTATLRPGAELAQAEAEVAAVDVRYAGAVRDLRLAQARWPRQLGTTTVPEIDARLPDITVIATAGIRSDDCRARDTSGR